MKKKLTTKILFALLLMISVYMISCSTTTTSAPTIVYGASVTPVNSLTALSIYNALHKSGGGAYTMGVVFRSAKKGRITHLGAKLSAGTYTVALWDSSAQSVIKSALVTVTDSSQYAFTDIDDVAITANKYYIITVNNTQNGTSTAMYYWVLNVVNPSDDYPHTIGDITFTSEIENLNSNPLVLFPSTYAASDYVMGFPEFKFEPQL